MDSKETIKLRALADKLILMANGLSSEQSQLGLDIANEFAPLAEFVIAELQHRELMKNLTFCPPSGYASDFPIIHVS